MTIADYLAFLTTAIAAASAASAVLPQTGPDWWIKTRKVIDFLAMNFLNARNAPPR